MAETKTDELDLHPFCETGVGYHTKKMDTPFISGGWLYATDGRICIRVPVQSPDDDLSERPDCASLFKGFDAASCNSSWDEIPPSQGECDCPQCEGEGSIPDEDGDDVRCQMCAGLGWLVMDLPRRVNGILFANLYDRLVKSLPGPVLFSPSDKPSAAYGQVRFVFDGGQGTVMGIKELEVSHA